MIKKKSNIKKEDKELEERDDRVFWQLAQFLENPHEDLTIKKKEKE